MNALMGECAGWVTTQPADDSTYRLGRRPTMAGCSSMQVQFRADEAICAGGDQGIGCDFDRVELSIQFAFPERQELAKHRITRRYVHFLPYEALQQARMIGHMVQ